jgi:hypothetical protein
MIVISLDFKSTPGCFNKFIIIIKKNKWIVKGVIVTFKDNKFHLPIA